MTKIAIVVALIVVVAVTYLLFRPAPSAKGATADISIYINGLMNASSENGVLIINVSGNADFVQFTGGKSGVQMDFPLITDRQLSFHSSIEKLASSMGLESVINTGTDGAKFLDIELKGTSTEISTTVEKFIVELYGSGHPPVLEFQTHGY